MYPEGYNGEMGRYPIEILIKSTIIGFWQRIINGKVDKISYKLYSIILNIYNRNLFYSKWITAIKSENISNDKLVY